MKNKFYFSKLNIINLFFYFGMILLIIAILICLNKIFTNEFNNNLSFYYLAILLFSISIIILYLCKLYLSNNAKTNIILTLSSFIIGIYLVEIYFEFFSSNKILNNSEWAKIRIEKAKDEGIEFDNRSLNELIADKKKEGLKIYPNVGPGNLTVEQVYTLKSKVGDIFPLGGISNELSALGNEAGYFPIVKMDKYGFNNPPDVYNKSIDIAIIGDSFAEGHSVESKYNIASILNKKNYNSIIFGKPGNGSLIEYATFREYVTPLKPKVVIWLIYENDFMDLNEEINIPILKRYLTDNNFSQNLIYKQNEIDKAYKDFLDNISSKDRNTETKKIKNENSFLKYINRIYKLYNIRVRLDLKPKPKQDNKVNDIFKLIIQNSKKAVFNWSGSFYLVYLPSYSHFVRNNNSLYIQLQKIVDELDVNFIDIFKIIQNEKIDPLNFYPFRVNGHYNRQGYRYVADQISKRVVEDNVFF